MHINKNQQGRKSNLDSNMGYFFAYSVIKTCNSKKITDWDKKTFEVEGISWKKINFANDFEDM